MLVYMLLNTITERAYVGATSHTLEERWRRHLKDARSGSTDRLHRAIREWPDEETWSRVVLSNCYSVEETSVVEQAWQKLCSVHDGAIGYNDSMTPYAMSVANGKKGGAPKKPTKSLPSAFMQKTDEEKRTFFRECGRKGAEKSRLRRRLAKPE